MNTHNKHFYLLTYTKGSHERLLREFPINIHESQWIEEKIKNLETEQLGATGDGFLPAKAALYVGDSFKILTRPEQLNYRLRPSKNHGYFLQEFEKPKPWFLIEEHSLSIGTETLREIFKDNPCYQNPNADTFTPNINANEEYAIKLQPYLSFKFKLHKYDYWINKRWCGQ